MALACIALSGCAYTSLTSRGLVVQGDAERIDYQGKFGALRIDKLNHSRTNSIVGANAVKAIGAVGTAASGFAFLK